VLGADALFSKGEAKGASFAYTTPLNGSAATVVTEPTVLDLGSEDQRLFLGAYASTNWRPLDRVTINGGVRLNATSERHDDIDKWTRTNRLSGSVGALVSLMEQGPNHVRAFANYRNTFKPAAFDFSLVETEEVLKPETSQNYEGGLKVRAAKGRLDLEASVFQMDFTNLVTATIVNNLPALINSGKTRFKGYELAANAVLSGGLAARATYSYHDGKFVDFVQDFDGTPTQLAGKRLEMSARHLYSAGLTYDKGTGVFATARANYTGDRYLNKRNTALAPSFTTVDAGVGYRWKQYEFRVDGRNLTDERDPVSESEFGDAQYYRNPARAVYVGVSVRY
jgi:iron complex outermembrane receptor protein